MHKDKNYNYKIILGFIFGILISAIGVAAATKYGSSTVFYDNSNSTLTGGDVQGAIDELASKILKNKNCPSGYKCNKTGPSLGDYVSMTPTKSSYTTDTSKTGYTSTQTINPQELNLWRVISLNSDGTVDMISEHVSSIAIYFSGQTGYLNFVGYLNVLASQYENSTYTKGSRHFGYNGQTEYITDKSKFTNPAPWTCSSAEKNCNLPQNQGGGDTLYQKDYNLVNNVLGTLLSTIPESKEATTYWMASRNYFYFSEDEYYWDGRGIVDFAYEGDFEINSDLYGFKDSSFNSQSWDDSIRPIVTLKSGLKYSGSGTKDDPLKLSAS